MINVAILGYGVVGGGTAEILTKKVDELKATVGQDIIIKYILLHRKDADKEYDKKFVTDYSVILNDDSVDIVVEAIGGTDPAYKYVKSALEKGKSVVTSNKELVAQYGDELMKIAFEKNVNFMFEGAVGGAIPIIHNVRNCIKANRVKSISGILNGTTNYILTKMIDENLSFDTALSQAQALGYAEADPSADVDGLDTCRKICILADIIYGKHIYPTDVYTQGIRNVRLEDVAILKKVGGHIKLLGMCKQEENGKIVIMTAPFIVFNQGILFAANDVFNAVQLETDNAGTMAFYGRGAGSLPTGSAVVNDICECAMRDKTLYPVWSECDREFLSDIKEIPMRFYINANVDLSVISKVFPNCQILSNDDNTAVITEPVSENTLNHIIAVNNINVSSILRVL